MEFERAVRARRMVRNFTDEPVPTELVDELLDLARRAPSAGYSQGVSFLVLEGDDVAAFWESTLAEEKRADFPWPGLLSAPVIVLPLGDSERYVERYAEPDKARTGLGAGADAWEIPYWHVDCAMATQNLLLAAVDRGLGALFFGLFDNEAAVCAMTGIPAGVRPIGAVALGWPAASDRPSMSVSRGRRPLDDVVHRGRWGGRA